MSRRFRALLVSGAVVALTCVGAASSWADGLPVPVDGGTNAIAGPGGGVQYWTHGNGPNTRVTRESATGKVLDSTRLTGRFTVPAVAIDGTPSGLSADGGTLVLIHPRERFPQAHTTFAILDARTLETRDIVNLRGDFSFDAVSPDGASVYLINYTSRDPTDYAVRSYDVAAGRLLSRPIVDPSEPDEDMRGYPLTRVTSPDGRWAYTLYDGGGGTPFVHALDTAEGTAHCIDLEGLRPAHLGLGRSADGATLTVSDRGGPVRTIDTSSFEVATLPPPGASASGGGDEADGGPDWMLIAAIALVMAGALGLGVRRRRRLAST